MAASTLAVSSKLGLPSTLLQKPRFAAAEESVSPVISCSLATPTRSLLNQPLTRQLRRSAPCKSSGTDAASMKRLSKPSSCNASGKKGVVSMGLGAKKPVPQFYNELDKPWWNPPSWLFGVAWSALYPLIIYSAWKVLQHGGADEQKIPLTIFAVQLTLNLLWPVFFFFVQDLDLALIDQVALLASIVVNILSFRLVDESAANLLLPYFAWSVYATALTLTIWLKNKKASF